MPPQYDPRRHHRRSVRLKGYDYTQPGAYFITICTYERLPLFGKIVAHAMQLNPAGQIARQEWLRLPCRFPSLEFGPFVIMPNHVHGLLIIRQREVNEARNLQPPEKPLHHPPVERFGQPVPGSIPTIVRSYKASVTSRLKRLSGGPDQPVWQRNYYEHVVRNDAELERIRIYIENNPRLWEQDRMKPDL